MAIIEGLLGLAGLASQSGWQGAANNVNWANLQFQKQQADKQYRLSTAGRSDAYGNKQRYDDLLNEWETILSPMQNQIVRAGEREQLKSLTEDASRNRNIKVRAAARGDEASKDYTKALSEFRYNQPASEASIRGELQQLLAGVADAKARSGNTDAVRTAVRQGNGGAIPQILGESRGEAGLSLPEILLQAKTGAMSEKQSRDQSFNSKYVPLLNNLAALMDQGGDMPQRFSTTPERLAGEQGQQGQMILQALQNGASNIGNAYGQISKTLASGGPDLRQLAALMSGGTKAPATRRSTVAPITPTDANGNSVSSTGFNWF